MVLNHMSQLVNNVLLSVDLTGYVMCICHFQTRYLVVQTQPGLFVLCEWGVAGVRKVFVGTQFGVLT